MANKYCNLDGSKKIKDEYPKINTGFDKVDIDIKSIITGQDLDPNKDIEVINARGESNTLSERLNATDERINNIIVTPAEGITEQEIIDARQGNLSLGANLMEFKNDYIALKEKVSPIINYNTPVRTPIGFNWINHPLIGRIFTDGKGNFKTDFDVSELKNVGGVTYYVSPTGSESNDGLSLTTPKLLIYPLLSVADCGTIMVKSGMYRMSLAGSGPITSILKNINIICYDGIATICKMVDKAYTKTEGYTNVYQITSNGVGRVVDGKCKGIDNEYLELVKLTTIAEVDNTPNSYCNISGIIYVRTIDSRFPSDKSVYPLTTITNLSVGVDGITLYMENLELLGGARPFRNDKNSNVYAKNCKFLYSTQSNGGGAEIVNGFAIFQNCKSTKNIMDGFPYSKTVGYDAPKFIEIDCEGYENGGEPTGLNSNNGSTAHEGCIGIRINGKYYRNNGGNVADVNLGTQTWNLGCSAFESKQGSDFLVTNTGGEMWLDECVGFGSTKSLDVANVESKAYVRNGRYQTENIVGTKVNY